MEAEHGGVGLAHQQVAVALHGGYVAELAAGTTLGTAITKADALGLQQRFVEGGEVQPIYSRRVVGWKLDQRMDAALVIEALNRALGHRRVESEKLLIHTDQGSQYRANDYRELLQKEKITCSMSAKGCCWDNAVVESFFSTLKRELNLDGDREVLISPQQLQRDLAFWIEGYYNRERRHSTIGYMSPIDYEEACIAARTLTPVNS